MCVCGVFMLLGLGVFVAAHMKKVLPDSLIICHYFFLFAFLSYNNNNINTRKKKNVRAQASWQNF